MMRYLNLSGFSGVVGYQIESTRIRVQFRDGKVYSYSSDTAGYSNLETMKRLAQAGRGLNTFINQNVKYRYE